jgi:predicted nucleotidyltransferase
LGQFAFLPRGKNLALSRFSLASENLCLGGLWDRGNIFGPFSVENILGGSYTINMIDQKILDKTIPILKSHGVARASIFGSFVRGEETSQSDIDLLIQPPRGMTLFGLGGLCSDLEEALHRTVDVVQYDFIKPALREAIMREKIDIL